MAALQPVPHPTPLVGKAGELDKQRFAAIEHRADVVDRRAAIIQMMETNRIPALQTWQYYHRSMTPFLAKMHSHAQRLIAASKKDHEKPEEAYDDDDTSVGLPAEGAHGEERDGGQIVQAMIGGSQ